MPTCGETSVGYIDPSFENVNNISHTLSRTRSLLGLLDRSDFHTPEPVYKPVRSNRVSKRASEEKEYERII